MEGTSGRHQSEAGTPQIGSGNGRPNWIQFGREAITGFGESPMIFKRRDDFHNGFSIGQFLSAPFRKLSKLTRSDDGIGQQRSLSQTILHFATIPFHWLIAMFGFVFSYWSTTRRGRAFLFGVPAILACLVMFAGLMVFEYFSDKISQRYRSLSSRSVLMEEYDSAEIFARKNLTFHPENTNIQFRLAEIIAQNDDQDMALAMMRRIAPDDKPTNIKAHLWIAEHFMRQDAKSVDRDFRDDQISRHLAHAAALEPNLNDKNRMEFLKTNGLAYQHFWEKGKYEKCATFLRQMAPLQPAVYPEILKVNQKLGQTKEFNDNLERAVFLLRDKVKQHPEYAPYWSALAQCFILNEDYENATRVLEFASRTISDPALKNSFAFELSGVLLKRSEDKMDWDEMDNFQQSIQYLNRAIAAFPQNQTALERALSLVTSKQFEDRHDGWLSTSTSTDRHSFLTHILMGLRALHVREEDGISDAIFHFDVARASVKSTNRVISFFARAASKSEFLTNKFALSIIQAAESSKAGDVWLLSARGAILMDEERYVEAALAYEACLIPSQENKSVIEALIECYEKSGNEEMAEKYRKELMRIEQQMPSI